MRLNVAYNWDWELLEKLSSQTEAIESFYGRARSSVLPGSRAATSLKETTQAETERHIEAIRKKGFKFSYLLNASPLADEFGSDKEEIIRQIEWIGGIADSIVVTSPYVAKLCELYAPKLEINSSILAHIDNPLKARRWAELGVKKIIPDWNVLRDFRTLEKIVGVLKPWNTQLEVLVNDPCMLYCPYVLCHDLAMAKGSMTAVYEHYWTFKCCYDYVRNPSEVLKSLFIRPEDLHYYEDIGIENFKIADRNRSTEFIVNAVNAYLNRNYPGNLAEILSIFSALGPHCAIPADQTLDKAEEFVAINIATPAERDYFWKNQLRPLMGLYIENQSLNGFLDFFVAEQPNCAESCGDCGYCEKWAEQVVSFNDPEITTRKLTEVFEKIHGENTEK
jgi:collagenase-like PrtC family protease